MKLNLIVLRSGDMARLADFYSAIGMTFTKHRHGKGPEHFGTEDCGLVLEIYAKRNDGDTTANVRIGFEVQDLEKVVENLKPFDYSIVSKPKDSPWGKRMIIDDLDGHRVELTEKREHAHARDACGAPDG